MKFHLLHVVLLALSFKVASCTNKTVSCVCDSGDECIDNVCMATNNQIIFNAACEIHVVDNGATTHRFCNKGDDFGIPSCSLSSHVNVDNNGGVYCCFDDFCNDCIPRELLDHILSSVSQPAYCKLFEESTDKCRKEFASHDVCSSSASSSLPSDVPSVTITSSTLASTPQGTMAFKDSPAILIISISVIFVVVVVAVIWVILLMLLYSRLKRRTSAVIDVPENGSIGDISQCSEPLNGTRVLSSRTVSNDIAIYECRGRGRFGRVHRGSMHERNVAVKIILSRHEEIWIREQHIYNQYGLVHDNILHMICADSQAAESQLYLVLDYHKNGNLEEFLSVNTVELPQSLNMSCSLLRGLLYLHQEFQGIKKKPAIAHRDLKSRNILVKDNLQLCIGDLGLAIVGEDGGGVDITITNKFSGTRRYMAPELLSGMMDFTKIMSFIRGDIYSVSLVIYELLNAAVTKTYHQPYHIDLIQSNPSIEQVKEVVVDRHIRPSWKDESVVSPSIFDECWCSDPTKRPSALGFLRKLQKVQSRLDQELEVDKELRN